MEMDTYSINLSNFTAYILTFAFYQITKLLYKDDDNDFINKRNHFVAILVTLRIHYINSFNRSTQGKCGGCDTDCNCDINASSELNELKLNHIKTIIINK